MMRRRSLIRGLAVLTLGLVLAGCQALVVPPPDPEDPVTVYLVDYGGMHNSLLLPTGDDLWLEYGYGELGWYARQEEGVFDALPAMLWDTEGAMSRREIRVTEKRPLERQFDLTVRTPLVVSAADVTLLLAELEGVWNAFEDEPIYHAKTRRSFIPISRDYSMSYNCNDAVAEWLRRLACEVGNPAIMGGFTVAPREDT